MNVHGSKNVMKDSKDVFGLKISRSSGEGRTRSKR